MKPVLKYEVFAYGQLEVNCIIIWDENSGDAIAIDPGDPNNNLIGEIKQRKLNLKAILHTHAHYDHIGGTREIKEELNIPIMVHQNDKELYDRIEEQGIFFGMKLGGPAKVDLYFQDGDKVGAPSGPLKNIFTALHTPGHTLGSSCFYSERIGSSPILLSGDTVFRGSIGRTDLPGGNSKDILKSIKNKILPLNDNTIIIPGHGPTTTIKYEKGYNPFF